MIGTLSVTPVAVTPPPGIGRSMKRLSLDLLGSTDATLNVKGVAGGDAWRLGEKDARNEAKCA